MNSSEQCNNSTSLQHGSQVADYDEEYRFGRTPPRRYSNSRRRSLPGCSYFAACINAGLFAGDDLAKA